MRIIRSILESAKKSGGRQIWRGIVISDSDKELVEAVKKYGDGRGFRVRSYGGTLYDVMIAPDKEALNLLIVSKGKGKDVKLKFGSDKAVIKAIIAHSRWNRDPVEWNSPDRMEILKKAMEKKDESSH